MSLLRGAHILVFPHPAQGHMIPLLDFTHLLSVKGLTITILVTPKNLPILSPLLSTSPSIQTLVLPLPPHPNIPPGVENVKDLPHSSAAAAIIRALAGLRDPIVQWFRSQPSPPVALISDFFLGWTESLACDLKIPRIVFYSSGALAVAVLNDLITDSNVRRDGSFYTLAAVPNAPAFEYKRLPAFYRRCVELSPTDVDWAYMRECMRANTDSWGAAYNTFAALESTYLHRAGRPSGTGQRVWTVGPLMAVGLGPLDRGGSSSAPAEELLAWLDTCPEGSVVYIAFGSEVLLSQQQVDALVAGLEASGVRFVLAVKIPGKEHAVEGCGTIPEGFDDRVSGQGRVVRGWAPQVAILGHRATGAFLTHCGWNSTLEGICAGVSLIAWPMGAEQFVNARLLVEETGLAVRVGEGWDSVPDPGQLARVLVESVSESKRARAKELSKACLDAVNEGGTSHRELEEMVNQLNALRPENQKMRKVGR